MSTPITIPDQLKIRLIITDKFSIHDFNVDMNYFRDISIAQIPLVEAKKYLASNDGYFNVPHLFTQPCKDIFTNLLEGDLSKNSQDDVKLDCQSAIIYITLTKELEPIFYLVVGL